jgi:hypothetical protein
MDGSAVQRPVSKHELDRKLFLTVELDVCSLLTQTISKKKKHLKQNWVRLHWMTDHLSARRILLPNANNEVLHVLSNLLVLLFRIVLSLVWDAFWIPCVYCVNQKGCYILNGSCMFVAIFGTAEKYGRHLTLAQSNVCTKMIYHKY